jgi:uncharacterized protein
MRILRAGDHKRMPWKNGGGETTEIAVFPEGAGLSDFDWRISMARVDGDGPFSLFPDIERTLAILEGAGIVLDVEGHAPIRLTIDSEPHAFPADAPTSATLIDGSILDFNVMSRRGKLAHVVRRCGTAKVSSEGALRLVLCSEGSLSLTTMGSPETLMLHDAALLDADDTAELIPGPGGTFYLVEFRAVPGA